jgi:hypothetical protein
VRQYEVDDDATVLDVVDVRRGEVTLPEDGVVALFDPIGGPIAVALAEELGDRAVLITQDQIAGNELSRTGDLAPANVRLAQRGVRVEKRACCATSARSPWSSRTASAVISGRSSAPPSSTADSGCRQIRCRAPRHRSATASLHARSTRRCSRDVAPLARSDQGRLRVHVAHTVPCD